MKKKLTPMDYPEKLVSMKHAWLSERKAYVTVNTVTSKTFDVDYGCIKGLVTLWLFCTRKEKTNAMIWAVD